MSNTLGAGPGSRDDPVLDPRRAGTLQRPRQLLQARAGGHDIVDYRQRAPGNVGGADWGGAAVDPVTGILYVPSLTSPIIDQLVPGNTPNAAGIVAWRFVRRRSPPDAPPHVVPSAERR